MAEINQPTPIKPVWPTRREQHPSKRNVPELSKERDRKKRKSQDDQDQEKPSIDEYV
ncbi:MAG: hypothetical protein GY792_04790 [Gammaproteobacteria bacterium]|nr:hypothetical protein [Gammaproteobacteria bacterium]